MLRHRVPSSVLGLVSDPCPPALALRFLIPWAGCPSWALLAAGRPVVKATLYLFLT